MLHGVSEMQAQEHRFRGFVNFESGSVEISSGTDIVTQICDSATGLKEFSIRLVGHSDSDGDEAFNLELSRQRVAKVTGMLMECGVDTALINAEYLGESVPITSNQTEEGKERNRRVECVFYRAPTQGKTTILSTSMRDFFDQSGVEVQEFGLSNSRDTIIRCKYGTILHVPANAFISGFRSGPIRLQVKEVYLRSDMILENLTTTSDERLIESQGMVYINAVNDSMNLKLRSDKEIAVFVPTDTVQQEAGIFTGERMAHSEVMNWTVNNNSILQDFTLPQLFICNDFLCGYKGGKCRFFFCKINGFFKSMFAKKDNATVNQGGNEAALENQCRRLKSMFEQYGVSNFEALIDAIHANLYKKYRVNNFNDLKLAMERRKRSRIEMAYQDRKLAYKDFKYYVYNTSRLGWSNVDKFMKVDSLNMVTMRVNLDVDIIQDVKLVFQDRNFVIPADRSGKQYKFKYVPKGERVWIVAIKYENAVPYLSMEKTTIDRKKHEVDFVQYDLNELKKKLKLLDRGD